MKKPGRRPPPEGTTELRIIGGDYRGRKLVYSGDPRTRPMKERVREAVFNLIREGAEGTYAIDLFAGTGALGLEAISRGAVGALFIERHFPTAKLIAANAAAIEMGEFCRVFPGSAFLWARQPDAPLDHPWLVFCSPPYAFYKEQTAEMIRLIESLRAAAPPDSWFVVETDVDLEEGQLPLSGTWDVRTYFPAVVRISRKFSDSGNAQSQPSSE